MEENNNENNADVEEKKVVESQFDKKELEEIENKKEVKGAILNTKVKNPFLS